MRKIDDELMETAINIIQTKNPLLASKVIKSDACMASLRVALMMYGGNPIIATDMFMYDDKIQLGRVNPMVVVYNKIVEIDNSIKKLEAYLMERDGFEDTMEDAHD